MYSFDGSKFRVTHELSYCICPTFHVLSISFEGWRVFEISERNMIFLAPYKVSVRDEIKSHFITIHITNLLIHSYICCRTSGTTGSCLLWLDYYICNCMLQSVFCALLAVWYKTIRGHLSHHVTVKNHSKFLQWSVCFLRLINEDLC